MDKTHSINHNWLFKLVGSYKMLESNNQISLSKALIPICVLISLLTYNIIFFENKDWFGENTYQIILSLAASLAASLGLTPFSNF